MAEKKKGVSSTTLIVISMVLGVVVGFIVGEPMNNVKFIGDIFFHLVQMGIIPFVMCTIIEAVGALDAKALSGYGLKGIGWFAASSLLAAGIGLVLTILIQPGAGIEAATASVDYQSSSVAKYFRINTGLWQSDTAVNTEANLVLTLQNYGSNVDYSFVWGQEHTMAERSGDSTTNFIEWVNECVKEEAQ